MMQRDEGDNLVKWLSHYGGLFGLENLTILDNGSTDPFSIAVLRNAQNKGSKIYWHFKSQEDFHHKGNHFSNIIKSWDNVSDYDFALPVDCDEIIAVFTESGLSTDRDPIHAALDELKPTKSALRMDMSMFNVPGRPGWFSPDRHFHKGFLPAGSIDVIDNGHHDPKSRLAPGHRTTRLTYLHWHNRSFDELVERTKMKLQGVVNTEDREAIQALAAKHGAVGARLCRILLSPPEVYPAMFDEAVKVFVGPGGSCNLIEKKDGIFLWSSNKYLCRNEDVRQNYELTPLHHYLRFGFLEGRQTGDPPLNYVT